MLNIPSHYDVMESNTFLFICSKTCIKQLYILHTDFQLIPCFLRFLDILWRHNFLSYQNKYFSSYLCMPDGPNTWKSYRHRDFYFLITYYKYILFQFKIVSLNRQEVNIRPEWDRLDQNEAERQTVLLQQNLREIFAIFSITQD